MDLLRETFGHRIISRSTNILWPTRSSNLTPTDYFLWRYVKEYEFSKSKITSVLNFGVLQPELLTISSFWILLFKYEKNFNSSIFFCLFWQFQFFSLPRVYNSYRRKKSFSSQDFFRLRISFLFLSCYDNVSADRFFRSTIYIEETINYNSKFFFSIYWSLSCWYLVTITFQQIISLAFFSCTIHIEEKVIIIPRIFPVTDFPSCWYLTWCYNVSADRFFSLLNCYNNLIF